MKRILPLFLLNMFIGILAKAQTITWDEPPMVDYYAEIPVLSTDGDSVYIEYTVNWPGSLDASEDNNVWIALFTDWGNYAARNYFLLKEEWFPDGGSPITGSKTYRLAFYVGNITTPTSYWVDFGAYFKYNGTQQGDNGTSVITYTP
ncbi:MAG: hypothetical protein QM731_25100 [Chitinophagaceae bacterium]